MADARYIVEFDTKVHGRTYHWADYLMACSVNDAKERYRSLRKMDGNTGRMYDFRASRCPKRMTLQEAVDYCEHYTGWTK